MGRSRKIVCITGEREIGKSTKCQEIIFSRNERTIVLDNSTQPAWAHLPAITMDKMKLQTKGIYRCTQLDFKMFFKILYDDWGSVEGKKLGGLAIVEDASAILKPNRDDDIFNMCIGLRHRNIDVVLVTHTIQETPKYIIRQLNEFIFMRTPDVWEEVKDRFPDRVREKAKQKFDIVQNSDNKYLWEPLTIIQTGTKTW